METLMDEKKVDLRTVSSPELGQRFEEIRQKFRALKEDEKLQPIGQELFKEGQAILDEFDRRRKLN